MKFLSSGLRAALFFSALATASATTFNVGNNSALSTALASVNPGDSIVMGNGNYSGFTVTRSGTVANPIMIQALNLGLATNNTGIIKFMGVSNVILSGLTLTTSGGSLTVDGTARSVGVVLTNCVNCRITHCNFKLVGIAGGTAWVMIGGPSYSNRVDHCDFGPNTKGNGTHFIWPVGNATISGVSNPSDRTPWAMGYGPFNPNMARYTQVDHNYFHDQASGVGEIMVLGAIGMTGDYQDGHTLIEYNMFENCNGDPEIVSVKSSSNTLRYNTVRTSAGVFSLRSGNNSSIYGNFFLCAGTGGGVKMCERDHKVFNNYIENSDTSNYPLMLESGNLYNVSFAHAEVVRAQISHNTVVSPGRQVLLAHSGSLPVVDTVVANNLITGTGTLYSEDVTSVNPMRSQNIIFGYTPGQSGFLVENPLLTGSSPQRLSASSPAINTGNTNYFAYVTDDMDGQVRNIPRDIGADEYSAGGFIARSPLTTNEVGPNSIDIELAATPALQTVNIGATNVSYTITVSADAGFTNPVTLTASGLLPGMSAGFSPATVNGSGVVTFNVTNTSAVLGGNYPFIITATSSNLASSVTVALQAGRGAVNLRWVGTASGVWNVQSTANWFNVASNAADAFYNGDTVLLDDTNGVPTNLTLAAGVVVSPSIVTNNSSTNNFIISGAGKISGAAKFVKTGSSLLTLNTTNDFGGGMLIAGGMLKAGNPFALGGQGGFIIVTNGATLDVNGNNLGLDTVLVSGVGVSNNGAIINSGADAFPALAVVELAGNTTIGGAHRWDLRSNNGNAAASLSTSGNGYTLTKTGTNFIGLVNVTVDPGLGNISLQAGTLEVESTTTCLGNPANTLTVFSNAVFELFNTVYNTNFLNLNKLVTLNDGAIFFNGNGANFFLGKITLNGSDTFNIGGTSLTCSNAIAGSGKLVKIGNGKLYLIGTNTYAGNTTISNGFVILSGNGSISNTAAIMVAVGATLDAGQRGDATLTLNRGQTLGGGGALNGNVFIGTGAVLAPGNSIGLITFSNNLTLGGGSTNVMELSKSPLTNDSARVAGTMTYGGTLALTNISGLALANGDSFKLFNAAGYSGSFTNVTPVIPGLNLAWNTSSLVANGILSVVSSPTPPPVFAGIVQGGSGMVFGGTNGVPGWTYFVLTSPDLTLPLASWTCTYTNVFAADGSFSFTNAIPPGAPDNFYLIQLSP